VSVPPASVPINEQCREETKATGNDDQQAKQQPPRRLVSRTNLEWEATGTPTSTGPPCPGASLRARITGEIAQARSRPLRPAVLRALTCSLGAAVLAAILGALASPNPAWVLAAASAGAVVGCILAVGTPMTARFGV